MPEPRKISFGFLLIPLQLLDMCGPMDVLFNVSTSYVSLFAKALLEGNGTAENYNIDDIVASTLDITFHHIGPTMEPVHASGGFLIQPTCTIETCPKLDYLLLGGPDPAYVLHRMPESMKKFIRQRTPECESVFATCTGAIALAATGVLDGERATVNHMCVDIGAQAFPAVKWSKNKNWVVSDNGKFWTAGGACAGMDMMAHWVRGQVSEDVFGLCTQALEYQPRDVDGKMLSFVNGRGERITVGDEKQSYTNGNVSLTGVPSTKAEPHVVSYELDISGHD